MKYVMFKSKAGERFPVILPDCVTHSLVSIQGATAVSAGFVDPARGLVFGHSQSLELGSQPEDETWVLATLTNNTAVMAALNCEAIEDEKLRLQQAKRAAEQRLQLEALR